MLALAARTKKDEFLKQQQWPIQIHTEPEFLIRRFLKLVPDRFNIFDIKPREHDHVIHRFYVEFPGTNRKPIDMISKITVSVGERVIDTLDKTTFLIQNALFTDKNVRDISLDFQEQVKVPLPFSFMQKPFPLYLLEKPLTLEIESSEEAQIYIETAQLRIDKPSRALIPIMEVDRDVYEFEYTGSSENIAFTMSAYGIKLKHLVWFATHGNDQGEPNTTTYINSRAQVVEGGQSRFSFYAPFRAARFQMEGKEYDQKNINFFKFTNPFMNDLITPDRNLYSLTFEEPLLLTREKTNQIFLTTKGHGDPELNKVVRGTYRIFLIYLSESSISL